MNPHQVLHLRFHRRAAATDVHTKEGICSFERKHEKKSCEEQQHLPMLFV
jgi:hypothetical protein